jgi:hypothetical protein
MRSDSERTTTRRMIIPAALLAMALAAACASSNSMDEGIQPDPRPSADSVVDSLDRG